MYKCEVELKTVESIQGFYSIVSKASYDIDLMRGRYIVDAKSILGIYSLDLAKPVDVGLHCDTIEEYKRFIQDLENIGIIVKEM